jgi:hypothetical protein
MTSRFRKDAMTRRAALLTSTAITRTPASGTSLRLPAGEFGQSRAIDRATWVSMVASARRPTGDFDEARVIDCVDAVVSTARYRMERKMSLEAIRAAIERLLREGKLTFTITTIQLADAGDEICDAGLRTVGGELQIALLQKRDLAPGHLQIIAYYQRAGQRAPHKRPRGHRWHDDWMRNILACWLIAIVERDFGIPPSHNRERSVESKRGLSGIEIVVAALHRHGIELDETNVQENIWFGPAGEIVRASISDNYIS